MKNKMLLLVDSDADGTACRCVAEYFLKDQVDVLQTNAGAIEEFLSANPVPPHYQIVGFSDLAPPLSVYEDLLKTRDEVHIWDHHVTSWDRLGGIPNDNYHYDVKKCSAKILYEWIAIYNPVAIEFVRLINIYDLWQDSHPDFDRARAINNLLYWYIREKRYKSPTYGYAEFIELQHKKFASWKSFGFTKTEQEVVDNEFEKEKIQLKKALKNLVYLRDAEGRRFAYFELGSKISYVCSEVLKQLPDLDYVMCHSTFDVEENRVSLRSKRIDVRSIAEKYKGGGHFFAAGVRLTQDQRESIRSGKEIFG